MATTSLTTEHRWTSFQADLVKQSQRMRYTAEHLATAHKQWDPYPNKRNWGQTRDESPDADSLYIGFTMLVAQLRLIVNKIQELEDLADGYDEEDAELNHSHGELFAYKEMYISILNSYESVEMERVKATEHKLSISTFMSMVCADGIPNVRPNPPAHARLFDAGMVTTSRPTAKTLHQALLSTSAPTPPPMQSKWFGANLAPNPSLVP